MKYQIRWWATTKEVSKLPCGGYTQEKIDRAGEADVSSHSEAVEYADGLFETFKDFALTEIKIVKLGDDA